MPESREYIIVLEYSNLKVTIRAKSYDATLGAYLLGCSVIEDAQELGFLKPKLTTTALIPKKNILARKG